jgi:hypothetical protein
VGWAVCGLLGAEVAEAATYYVSSSQGSDANNGGSPASAWKTLAKAVTGLQPGDTLYIMEGTYSAALLDTVQSGESWE